MNIATILCAEEYSGAVSWDDYKYFARSSTFSIQIHGNIVIRLPNFHYDCVSITSDDVRTLVSGWWILLPRHPI